MRTRLLRDVVLTGAVLVGVILIPACGGQHDSPTFTDTSETSVTTSPTAASSTP